MLNTLGEIETYNLYFYIIGCLVSHPVLLQYPHTSCPDLRLPEPALVTLLYDRIVAFGYCVTVGNDLHSNTQGMQTRKTTEKTNL